VVAGVNGLRGVAATGAAMAGLVVLAAVVVDRMVVVRLDPPSNPPCNQTAATPIGDVEDELTTLLVLVDDVCLVMVDSTVEGLVDVVVKIFVVDVLVNEDVVEASVDVVEVLVKEVVDVPVMVANGVVVAGTIVTVELEVPLLSSIVVECVVVRGITAWSSDVCRYAGGRRWYTSRP